MNIKPKRSYAWSLLVLFLIIGWIYPVVGIMALVCMLAPIIVALVSGKRNGVPCFALGVYSVMLYWPKSVATAKPLPFQHQIILK